MTCSNDLKRKIFKRGEQSGNEGQSESVTTTSEANDLIATMIGWLLLSSFFWVPEFDEARRYRISYLLINHSHLGQGQSDWDYHLTTLREVCDVLRIDCPCAEVQLKIFRLDGVEDFLRVDFKIRQTQ